MKKVVLLTGVIGSGKDYTATKYIDQGYQRLSFADGVRECAWTLLNWKPSSDKEYQDFKTCKITFDTNQVTGREFLINIGDGFRKIFGETLWIDRVRKLIRESSHDKFTISDCRYTNEVLELQKEFDVELVFCNYKSERFTILNDPSEWMAIQLLDKGFENWNKIPLEIILKLHEKFQKVYLLSKK